MIQNPKKEFNVKSDIETVYRLIGEIPKISLERINRKPIDSKAMGNYGMLQKQYTVVEKDDYLKHITIKCPEALSAGSTCWIILEEGKDGNVHISMEMQRVIGSYNESHEIAAADAHIKNLVEYISFLLMHQDNWKDKMILKWGKTEYDLTPEEKEEMKEQQKKSNKNGLVFFVVAVAILIFVLTQL